jgi:hypothetical protein
MQSSGAPSKGLMTMLPLTSHAECTTTRGVDVSTVPCSPVRFFLDAGTRASSRVGATCFTGLFLGAGTDATAAASVFACVFRVSAYVIAAAAGAVRAAVVFPFFIRVLRTGAAGATAAVVAVVRERDGGVITFECLS